MQGAGNSMYKGREAGKSRAPQRTASSSEKTRAQSEWKGVANDEPGEEGQARNAGFAAESWPASSS